VAASHRKVKTNAQLQTFTYRPTKGQNNLFVELHGTWGLTATKLNC